MGKNNDGEAGNDITSTPNGEASESNGSDSVAKAFDTMAKAVRPQANLSLNQVSLDRLSLYTRTNSWNLDNLLEFGGL